jgi:hypothetical protein
MQRSFPDLLAGHYKPGEEAEIDERNRHKKMPDGRCTTMQFPVLVPAITKAHRKRGEPESLAEIDFLKRRINHLQRLQSS